MWVPSTFQWNPIARVVVQRPEPCENLSEMIPVRVPTKSPKVTGLKSESVTGFIPES
jgi:hypothetical protein